MDCGSKQVTLVLLKVASRKTGKFFLAADNTAWDENHQLDVCGLPHTSKAHSQLARRKDPACMQNYILQCLTFNKCSVHIVLHICSATVFVRFINQPINIICRYKKTFHQGILFSFAMC